MSIEYSIVSKCLFVYVISINESGLHWLNSNNFEKSKCKGNAWVETLEFERDVIHYSHINIYIKDCL